MRGRSLSMQRLFMNNLMWTVKREVKWNTLHVHVLRPLPASLPSPCVSLCVCVWLCVILWLLCSYVYVLCLRSNSCLCIWVYGGLWVWVCVLVCRSGWLFKFECPGNSNAYQIPVEHFLWFLSYQWIVNGSYHIHFFYKKRSRKEFNKTSLKKTSV